MYMEQSERYKNTWAGLAVAHTSAVVMWPISQKILNKWRDHPEQTAREYLYRFVLFL